MFFKDFVGYVYSDTSLYRPSNSPTLFRSNCSLASVKTNVLMWEIMSVQIIFISNFLHCIKYIYRQTGIIGYNSFTSVQDGKEWKQPSHDKIQAKTEDNKITTNLLFCRINYRIDQTEARSWFSLLYRSSSYHEVSEGYSTYSVVKL